MLLYNIAIEILQKSYHIVWAVKPIYKFLKTYAPKVSKHVMGQRGLFTTIQEQVKYNSGKEVYWFHAASFGEYNVIRPIIKRMRNESNCLVVTFFSPTGCDMLSALNQQTHEVDYIFYLPLDTCANVNLFLDTIRPTRAVFVISEYWLNYLNILNERNIPTYVISMLVDNNSYLLKWYGYPIRKALKAIHTFVVLDEQSKKSLSTIGFANVIVTGDPLFDNAVSIAKEPYHNTIVEHFCSGKEDVFVAGSISDEKDIMLVASLANTNRDVKFIVVPHEISEEGLNEIIYQMEGKALLYSECDEHTDFNGTQVLIIDFLGALSRLYRYGSWAYVGGGFTPYLHSVIEPVVYGIPVFFGPRIGRKRTPKQMIDIGIGCMVKSKKDFIQWFSIMREPKQLEEIRKKAIQYVEANTNVTNTVIQAILA